MCAIFTLHAFISTALATAVFGQYLFVSVRAIMSSLVDENEQGRPTFKNFNTLNTLTDQATNFSLNRICFSVIYIY